MSVDKVLKNYGKLFLKTCVNPEIRIEIYTQFLSLLQT